MARCLLLENKLPQSFWAEAVSTSVYLLNRLPTKAVDEMTPFEAWSGIQPSAKHLKVFAILMFLQSKEANLNRKVNWGSL